MQFFPNYLITMTAHIAVTGYDRKQVKYRSTEHLKEERKNGVRNIKENTTSVKKDMVY